MAPQRVTSASIHMGGTFLLVCPPCLYWLASSQELAVYRRSNRRGQQSKRPIPQQSTAAGSGGVVICGFVAKPSAVRNRRLCLVPHTCRGQHGHVCIRQRWVSDHPPERYSVVRQRQAYALSVPCVFPDYSALFTAIRRASSLLFRSHLLVWPQRNPNPPARNPETACRSK